MSTHDLYALRQLSTIDLIAPFDRYIDVYGSTLMAMPATGATPITSDYLLTLVSNAVQEILSPSGANVVSSQQAAILTNFANANMGQLIGYSGPSAYSPSIIADDANVN